MCTCWVQFVSSTHWILTTVWWIKSFSFSLLLVQMNTLHVFILGSAWAALHESDYQNHLSLSHSAPLYLKPSGTPAPHILEGKREKPACVQKRSQSLLLKVVNPVNPGNGAAHPDVHACDEWMDTSNSYLRCLMIAYPQVVQDVNLSCYKCSKKLL